MKKHFRFLSRGSTRYGVSHESNIVASSFRCGSAYHMDAIWNSETKSIWSKNGSRFYESNRRVWRYL